MKELTGNMKNKEYPRGNSTRDNHSLLTRVCIKTIAIFLIITASIAVYANAQTIPPYQTIEVNNISTGVNADGLLFWNQEFPPLDHNFEVPRSSGKSTIYAANLWIGGIDLGNNLHLAAQTYKQSEKRDFWPGPVNINDMSAADSTEWNKVWKVTKQEIDFHRENYNNPSYSMPVSIATWPANGNQDGNKFSKHLAPFFDKNNNGIYEPHLGETPFIHGDEALYIIYNDMADQHRESGALPLGIEVQAMIYGFNSEPPLGNTLFVRYRIFNRSNLDYYNVYMGMWTDFDLGYAFDDFVGTSTEKNMIYAYNSSNNDPGLHGYGENPPAQGVLFLNKNITRSRSYLNELSPDGNPSLPNHYYATLEGKRLNNEWPKENGEPVQFSFRGNPCDSTGNTEFLLGNMEGDRRIIGTTGPFTFTSGTFMELDLAFIYARSNQGHIHSVCKLFEEAEIVKEHYQSDIITNLPRHDERIQVKIIPNPVKGISTIVLPVELTRNSLIEIIDITGRRIKTIDPANPFIHKYELAKGMYLLKLTYERNIYHSKFMVD